MQGYAADPASGQFSVSGSNTTEAIAFTSVPAGAPAGFGLLGLDTVDSALVLVVGLGLVVAAIVLVARGRRPTTAHESTPPADAGEPTGSDGDEVVPRP